MTRGVVHGHGNWRYRVLLAVNVLMLVVLVSFLMVSRAKYRSFKDLDLRSSRSYKYLLVPAALLCIAALNPQMVLMLAGFGYLLSGIIPRLGGPRAEPPRVDGSVPAAGGAAGAPFPPGADDAR